MVTAKDRDDKVELTVSIPVEEKHLGDTYRGDGFSPRDLATFDFKITIKHGTFVRLMEEMTAAHVSIEQSRADRIERELVEAFTNQVDVDEYIV